MRFVGSPCAKIHGDEWIGVTNTRTLSSADVVPLNRIRAENLPTARSKQKTTLSQNFSVLPPHSPSRSPSYSLFLFSSKWKKYVDGEIRLLFKVRIQRQRKDTTQQVLRGLQRGNYNLQDQWWNKFFQCPRRRLNLMRKFSRGDVFLLRRLWTFFWRLKNFFLTKSTMVSKTVIFPL